MRRSLPRSALICFGISWLAVACGSDPEAESSATGGNPSTGVGGAGTGAGTGGAGRPAGGSASGGTLGTTGGLTSTGGAISAPGGGSPPGAGGAVSTGGKGTTGGANTGGALASTGGKSSSGGKASSGGVEGKGGADGATGGRSSGGGGTGGAAAGAAGKTGTGGASTGGSPATGGTGNQPAIGPAPCGCETPAGEFGTVNQTIVVAAGQTYDGQCKIFRANPSTLGDGNQDEDQKPVFKVEDGATLKNVVLGASAADGVHIHGDATLENIHWLDIGEDAMTIKESGTVHLNCGSATKGSDKVFQVNAAADITITNFTASDAGKFMRQNGDTTFKMTVVIDHCDISGMDEVIYRTDSSSSHVTLKNSRYSDLGDGLFRFGSSTVNGNSGQSTVSNNQEY